MLLRSSSLKRRFTKPWFHSQQTSSEVKDYSFSRIARTRKDCVKSRKNDLLSGSVGGPPPSPPLIWHNHLRLHILGFTVSVYCYFQKALVRMVLEMKISPEAVTKARPYSRPQTIDITRILGSKQILYYTNLSAFY